MAEYLSGSYFLTVHPSQLIGREDTFNSFEKQQQQKRLKSAPYEGNPAAGIVDKKMKLFVCKTPTRKC